MPYSIKGNTVIKKNTGKVVGHSSDPKTYLRVLNAIEHSWRPTGASSKTLPAKQKHKKKVVKQK
jgi:aspartokinase-like uncharacterized kinase